MLRKSLLSSLALCHLVIATACNVREQTARITAQDHRFVPAEIRLSAASPFRLTLTNEGREPHEFASPLLTDPQVRILADDSGTARATGRILVRPGRSADVAVLAPAGTYLFRCKVRGHGGMTGTLIVESSKT
ncbi:MAG: cupredoxin domain-containing protein [Nitrospirota bacterium]